MRQDSCPFSSEHERTLRSGWRTAFDLTPFDGQNHISRERRPASPGRGCRPDADIERTQFGIYVAFQIEYDLHGPAIFHRGLAAPNSTRVLFQSRNVEITPGFNARLCLILVERRRAWRRLVLLARESERLNRGIRPVGCAGITGARGIERRIGIARTKSSGGKGRL